MSDHSGIKQLRLSIANLRGTLSEYRMSLDLGHSNSYIRSITSGKALPSMSEFLAICDYFGITPKDFFDEKLKNPEQLEHLLSVALRLHEEDLAALVNMAERLEKLGLASTDRSENRIKKL